MVLPNPSPVYPGTPAPEVQEAERDNAWARDMKATAPEHDGSGDEEDSDSVSFASPRSNASSFMDLVDASRTGTSVATDDIDVDDFDFVDDDSTDGGF